MTRLAALAFVLAAAAAAQPAPQTRAEATDYRETSRYEDVMAFAQAVAAESPALHLTTFGESGEGRALPLLVWNAPSASAEDVVRSTEGRGVRALVLANIHAGEVAGKEAALALARDLAAGRLDEAWRDLVVLIAPVYNADGNERVSVDNRPLQYGPVGGMGQRPNAAGLDLNRDFTKLDAPETRALVRLLNDYEPHVLIDLHTTNGTLHGYGLTWAPPLHPSTSPMLTGLLRGAWLPAVARSVRERAGEEIAEYGNLKGAEWGLPEGWASFSAQPRFSTNYAGLRGTFGVLAEAYSYASFEDRVRVSKVFTEEVLGWAARHEREVRLASEIASDPPAQGDSLALRSTWREDGRRAVLLGGADTLRHPETGLPMLARTPARRDTLVPDYTTFEATERGALPSAYLVPDTLVGTLELLRLHGVSMRPLADGVEGTLEVFHVDSVRAAPRPFQGRVGRELFGAYRAAEVPEGRYVVVQATRLAFALLEPRSDDGLAAWGLVTPDPGRRWPVLRLFR